MNRSLAPIRAELAGLPPGVLTEIRKRLEQTLDAIDVVVDAGPEIGVDAGDVDHDAGRGGGGHGREDSECREGGDEDPARQGTG